MNDRLIQRDIFSNERIFELTDIGLRGVHKGLFSSSEYFVDYDDVGSRILKKKSGTYGWLIAAGVCLLLFVGLTLSRATGGKVGDNAEIFYLIVAIICGLVFISTYKRSFYLVKPGNTNAIEFFYDKPTKTELDNFIERIRTRRNQTLDEKYGRTNSMLPYEQNHQNLMWLLSNDVITKNEFDRRLDDLNLTFNRPSERKIGFDLGEN